MTEPLPGDFFMAPATATWIGVALRYACGQRYVHSGVYLGNGKVIEASMRYEGGARINDLSRVLARHGDEIRWSNLDTGAVQRSIIVRAARRMEGRPFPSKLAMLVGILRRHRGDVTRPYLEQPWWVRTILNGELTAYCLQIPYYAYRAAGIDLTPDGRPEGLVRPVDLLPYVSSWPVGCA